MTIKIWQKQQLVFTILLIVNLLFIPTLFAEEISEKVSAKISEEAVEEILYTIKSGDTLWSISQAFLNNANNWKKLQTLNNIQDPHKLTPNKKIRIPSTFLKPEKKPPISIISSIAKKNRIRKSAIIKNIQGSVIITSSDGNEKKATLGMHIHEGDTINTHAASSIRVVFKSGSASDLQENSQLIIKELKPLLLYTTSSSKPSNDSKANTEKNKLSQKKNRNTKLHLIKGTISNDIKEQKTNSHFIITTPSAVASVRGTIFRVASDPLTQQFRVEVLDGSVAVSNEGKAVVVNKGFGIVIKEGKQPEKPQQLLEAANLSKLQKSFDQTPVFFRFPQVTNAIAYRVELSEQTSNNTTSFQQQIFSKDITKPNIRLAHLKNGRYILRVFSYDKNGLGGKVAYHQFTVNVASAEQAPLPPSLISPVEQATINKKHFSFRWKSTSAASKNGYHFQLARDPEFNQLLVNIFPYYYNELAISDRLPNGQYYWHVGALDKQNKTYSFTDSRSFRLLPATPTLLNAQYKNDNIQISWHTQDDLKNKPAINAETRISLQSLSNKQKKALAVIKYRLQIASDKRFSNIIIDTTLSESHYKLPRKTLGELYIKVTNIGADGYFSPAGKIQHLRLEKKGFFDRQIINVNDKTTKNSAIEQLNSTTK